MSGIFGQGNVVNAASAFGAHGSRNVSNYVWFLKHELAHWVPGRPQSWHDQVSQDLQRGERILAALTKRMPNEQQGMDGPSAA